MCSLKGRSRQEQRVPVGTTLRGPSRLWDLWWCRSVISVLRDSADRGTIGSSKSSLGTFERLWVSFRPAPTTSSPYSCQSLSFKLVPPPTVTSVSRSCSSFPCFSLFLWALCRWPELPLFRNASIVSHPDDSTPFTSVPNPLWLSSFLYNVPSDFGRVTQMSCFA